jgi:hypothetical protein
LCASVVVRCGVRGVAGEARTVVRHGNGAVRAAEQQDAPSGAWERAREHGRAVGEREGLVDTAWLL